MEEKKRKQQQPVRTDHWLQPNIVVKVVTKRLGDKYHKKKAVIMVTGRGGLHHTVQNMLVSYFSPDLDLKVLRIPSKKLADLTSLPVTHLGLMISSSLSSFCVCVAGGARPIHSGGEADRLRGQTQAGPEPRGDGDSGAR